MHAIQTVIIDFSRVLLFPTDSTYSGSLNTLHKNLILDNPHYDFLSHFALNTALLEYLKRLSKTTPVYIFTSDAIQNHSAIREKVRSAVTGVFSAKDLGIDKSKSNSYAKLFNILGIPPAAALYIDDQQVNLDAAKTAGAQSVLYRHNPQIINDIEELLRVL